MCEPPEVRFQYKCATVGPGFAMDGLGNPSCEDARTAHITDWNSNGAVRISRTPALALGGNFRTG
jgi:hypothetical protein